MAEYGTRFGKRDIVKVLVSHGIAERDAFEVTNQIIESMARALACGRPIIFTNFGTLKPITSRGRVARNPQTGERVEIEDTIRPKFYSSPQLQNVLNGKGDRQGIRKKPRS